MKRKNNSIDTRLLKKEDIPLLMDLERKQWSENQLPCEKTLEKRIVKHPDLCIGSFCTKTGEALASTFMKPTCDSLYTKKITWNECSAIEENSSLNKYNAVFGISLTSINAQAANALFEFFYPRSLKFGYQYVYMGSPMPGFKRFNQKNPNVSAEEYVHQKNKNLEPKDPQLNYYYKKGFHHIVSVQENYFPHEKSLDYGVIMKNKIPLAQFHWVWRHIPLSYLSCFKNVCLDFLRRPLGDNFKLLNSVKN